MTPPSLPSDPDKISSKSESPPQGSRRRFFGWVITAVDGFIGLGLGVPLAGNVSLPTLKPREVSRDKIGSIKDLPIDTPVARVSVNTIKYVSS